METTKEIPLPGNRLFRLFQDPYSQNPRKEFGTFGQFVLYSRKFSTHFNLEENDRWSQDGEDLEEWLKENAESAYYLPVYARESYNQLQISTENFGNGEEFGFIWMGKKTADEYKVNEEQALQMLESEVETLNDYLTGNVWGYEVVKLEVCHCCNTQKETHEDSCFGFYGEPLKSGILDSFPKEEMEVIEKGLKEL